MEKDTRETLKRYLRSVDLLIEDVELQKKDYVVDIYFDTADIRDSALGAEACFDDVGAFDRAKLQDTRMWVQMLFSAGWLGPVRLLPPHQAELLSLVTLNFGVDSNGFARKARTVRKTVESHLPPQSGNDLVDDARSTAERARELFKMIEACRLAWPARIRSWREGPNPILDLETFTPDYAKIVNAEKFHDIETALARKRYAKERNNSTDAAAILTLVEAVAAREKTRRMPLFYVPSRNHWEVLRETGIAEKLTYAGARGPVSILRDSAYFIARALLIPGSTAPASAGRVQPRDLRRFRQQLQSVIANHPIIDQALLHLNVGGKAITETVRAFLGICFFTNVWTPYGELYPEAVKDAGEPALYLTTKQAQQEIERALKTVRERLRINAKQFNRVGQLRDRLSTAAKRLAARTRDLPRKPGRTYIRAFGLFRFVPPKEVVARVVSLLDEICSDTDVTRNAALSRTLLLYEQARSGSASPDDTADLSAILWVLEFDDLLMNVLRRVKREGWLAFLYPATLLRARRLLNVAESTLRGLTADFPKAADDTEKLRQAAGIAYLSFHLSLRRGFKPTWMDRGQPSGPPESEALIEQAVHYAEIAARLPADIDPYLNAYSLNQVLYYSVAAGRTARAQLRERADALNNGVPNDSDLWDYRYDDTLARYYYLLACTTASVADQRDLSITATHLIDRAFNGAPHGDPEVERFRLTLQNFRDELSEKTGAT